MARRVKSTCEIALSKADLDYAVWLWLDKFSMGAEFRVSKMTLHPDAKYVVRATIEPPAARKSIADAVDEKADSKSL